jgi:hypothetical protein
MHALHTPVKAVCVISVTFHVMLDMIWCLRCLTLRN